MGVIGSQFRIALSKVQSSIVVLDIPYLAHLPIMFQPLLTELNRSFKTEETAQPKLFTKDKHECFFGIFILKTKWVPAVWPSRVRQDFAAKIGQINKQQCEKQEDVFASRLHSLWCF